MPPVRRARLPRGTLNRTSVLDATARILERGGVGALTMTALADELGADRTAVYRHFRGKDDLLAALTDRLLSELPPPDPAAGWREQLTAVATDLRAAMLRYPGSVGLLAVSPFSAAGATLVERQVAGLLASGLDEPTAVDAVQAVVAYVMGSAEQALSDAEGFWSELPAGATPASDFPAVHATASMWTRPPAEHFERGLALLLDGVAGRARR